MAFKEDSEREACIPPHSSRRFDPGNLAQAHNGAQTDAMQNGEELQQHLSVASVYSVFRLVYIYLSRPSISPSHARRKPVKNASWRAVYV